jgi:dihydroxyacetone kinase-like protein
MIAIGERETRELVALAHSVIAANESRLTELDQAIGDGDHGANLKRGFDGVAAEVDKLAAQPPADALKAAGLKLIMTVGGASGPLFGTFLSTLGKSLNGADTLAEPFGKATDAVAALGKSHAGQKTMLDVLVPVQRALDAGAAPAEIARIAAAAAEATIPMQAERGRASFLGPRSVGHMDPGSCSSALLIAAVAQWASERSERKAN